MATAALIRQYCAALEMLKKAVEQCPEALWADDRYSNRVWQIAYHALFYTHLYLGPSDKDFMPWPSHRHNANRFQMPPVEPYSQAQILDYIEFCRAQVTNTVPALPLEAPSGFYWLKFNRLELHLYNLRHLQHHTAQLIDRLRNAAGIGVGWVAQG